MGHREPRPGIAPNERRFGVVLPGGDEAPIVSAQAAEACGQGKEDPMVEPCRLSHTLAVRTHLWCSPKEAARSARRREAFSRQARPAMNRVGMRQVFPGSRAP
jgi:hypothetical protein